MKRHGGRYGGNNQAMRVIKYLRMAPGRPATTLELHRVTGSLAVSRDVSNARAMLAGTDEEILPAQLLATRKDGTRIYAYTLIRRSRNGKSL